MSVTTNDAELLGAIRKINQRLDAIEKILNYKVDENAFEGRLSLLEERIPQFVDFVVAKGKTIKALVLRDEGEVKELLLASTNCVPQVRKIMVGDTQGCYLPANSK